MYIVQCYKRTVHAMYISVAFRGLIVMRLDTIAYVNNSFDF